MSDSPLKDFPMDQPLPKWAVERMTTDVVAIAVNAYDSMIAKPRHNENIERFKVLEDGQKAIATILAQIQGAIKVFYVLSFIVGLLSGIFLLLHRFK